MPEYWEKTQEILQSGDNPLVDKPKLAEKHLVKPPFRFLHDVITAVQTNTGFAPGLFSGIELNGKDQDKNQKVAYLTKIIGVVGLTLNEHVPAIPLKIIAGLEPENTNLFLQMLGRAAKKNDGAEAVKRVLSGGAAPPARPSSRPSSQQKPGREEPEPAPPPKSSSKKAPEEPRPSSRSEEKPASAEGKSRSSSKPRPESKAEEEQAKPRAPQRSSKAAPAEDSSAPEPPRTGSAGEPQQAGKFARPQSARKAPPKLPSNEPVPAAKPGAARPGTAQRPGSKQNDRPGSGPSAKPVHLFEEGVKDDDEDEVEVVHEAAPTLGSSIGPIDTANQGVLVKNILEAEKNLKKAGEAAAVGGENGEAGGTGIILKRSGKPTSASAAKPGDLAAVRDLVQKLCQSSHPLAKSMDYLQEDLENMAKEYRFWVTERRVYQEKLLEEQRLVQDLTSGENKIADMDSQIKQVKDRNIGHKGQILHNDETVTKLLNMIVSGNR